jgi:hypothetical protein
VRHVGGDGGFECGLYQLRAFTTEILLLQNY